MLDLNYGMMGQRDAVKKAIAQDGLYDEDTKRFIMHQIDLIPECCNGVIVNGFVEHGKFGQRVRLEITACVLLLDEPQAA